MDECRSIKSPPNLFPSWTDNRPDTCRDPDLARLQKQHLFGSQTSSRTLPGKLEIPFLVGTLSHHPSSPFLSGRLRRARMPRPFSRFSHVFRSISLQKVLQNSSFWSPKGTPKGTPKGDPTVKSVRFGPLDLIRVGLLLWNFSDFSDFSLRRRARPLAGPDRPSSGSDFLRFPI